MTTLIFPSNAISSLQDYNSFISLLREKESIRLSENKVMNVAQCRLKKLSAVESLYMERSLSVTGTVVNA